jgi:hypothetical protein
MGPEWQQLARRLGGIDAQNNVRLNGMVMIQAIDEAAQMIEVRLITPIRAGFYDEDLSRKSPPVRFDRTPAGHVAIPGRWFLDALEAIRDDPARSATERALARTARQYGGCDDVHVTENGVQLVDILLPETGESILCEVLVPPITLRVQLVGPNRGRRGGG